MEGAEAFIGLGRLGLDRLGDAVSDLMGGFDQMRSIRVMEEVRECMTAMNGVYNQFDLVQVQAQSDLIERSLQHVAEFQGSMEKLFVSYAKGQEVNGDMIFAFSGSWMDFRQAQEELLDYLEDHPELQK